MRIDDGITDPYIPFSWLSGAAAVALLALVAARVRASRASFTAAARLEQVLKLEAELDFASVLLGRSGVFDGRGVNRFCVLGDRCPVGCGDLSVVLDLDVSIGDAGEGGCVAEVVDESLPCGVVSGGVVEVAFEPVGLVAPDGPTGGPGGDRSEYVEVELGGMVGESQHAVDAGVMDSGVELVDVVAECVPLCCGGGEFGPPGLLMAVEVGKVLSGRVLVSLGVGEELAGGV